MRSKVKISVLIKYIVLCSVALIMLYPLFWVFLSSLKENNEIFSRPFSFPLKPKWDNYSTAWEAADVPLHMLNTFMESIPKELEEAAKIDGCNRVQIFWKIILPISKSGLATVATFVLINSWNDLFLSLLIISKQSLITLNQVCYNMKAQYVADYGLISAAIIILVLPVIVLFVVFQKQVIKGMTAGSVKG